jgi:homoserine O-succinyltransferase
LAFEEVNYWQELCQIIDSVTKAHIPILAVCWGAQALLYKRYGIEKIALGEKCFGVYEHKTKLGHPLTQAVAEKIYLPHSRHTGWCVETLKKHEQLEIIIDSEEAGVFALEDGEGDWYWSGHPEYEIDTLLLEYRRDLSKGLSIVAPRGYQEKKRDEWVVETPWQETASCLLCNWINAIVPRELGNHDKRRY